MHRRKSYGFESIVHFDASPHSTPDYDSKFLGNLNLGRPVSVSENAEIALRHYVASIQVNCAWYNEKLFWEKALQWLFFVISILLLISLPLIIYWAPIIFASWDSSVLPWIEHIELTEEMPVEEPGNPKTYPAELPALLTALLSGTFAAHRTISAWLNQRKFIGTFWKARSNLLNLIYTFETEWGPRPLSEKTSDNGKTLSIEFKKAIDADIQAARLIIQAEREQFYSSYTFPDIDLAKSILDSGTQANSLMTLFESAHTKKERELEIARSSHAVKFEELEADVAGLDAILTDWNLELERTKTTLGTEDKNSVRYLQLEAEVKAITEEIAKLMTERKLKIRLKAEEKTRGGL